MVPELCKAANMTNLEKFSRVPIRKTYMMVQMMLAMPCGYGLPSRESINDLSRLSIGAHPIERHGLANKSLRLMKFRR